MGIITYCLIFLMKLDGTAGFLSDGGLTEDAALFDSIGEEALCGSYRMQQEQNRELLRKKNTGYGDAWRSISLPSMTDQVIIRVYCIRRILSNGGRTTALEGIAVRLHDIVNYCVFVLVKMDAACARMK